MPRHRSEWLKVIEEYHATKEPQVPFCERRGLSLHMFQYWLYRLRREGAAPMRPRKAMAPMHMVPVTVRLPAPIVASDAGILEIVLPGSCVRVRVGQDVDYVAALAAALIARC